MLGEGFVTGAGDGRARYRPVVVDAVLVDRSPRRSEAKPSGGPPGGPFTRAGSSCSPLAEVGDSVKEGARAITATRGGKVIWSVLATRSRSALRESTC